MKKISFNSPIVLGFVFISACALLLGYISDNVITRLFFCTFRAPLIDPLTFIRLFTHVLGHASFQHFYSNMLIFLLTGPLLEEKYGSKNILVMILATAFVSGIINNILFPNTALLGASGICFMFIILSSITCVEYGKIPLTFILVTIMYLGNEIINGIITVDNISQLTHIIGGICGAFFGIYLNKMRIKRNM